MPVNRRLPLFPARPLFYECAALKGKDMQEPEITEDLVAAHGFTPEEYQEVLRILDREPTFTELGIFSAMWNEHCSYKVVEEVAEGPSDVRTAGHLRPGRKRRHSRHRGRQGVVFKMESHNHPSYIEPYQGAATGVGGILRDIFTMGARPVAAMNALSFGEPGHPRTRRLVSGVVEGIGGYGTAFGVPTTGGEVRFHSSYNGTVS